MKWKYTVDPSADEPIMLLTKYIGVDPVEGDGVLGDEFAAELHALDTLGKERICIHVNCPGGAILDGYAIYSAILKTKTPVDTYNVGMAASSGSWIFLAGRKRYMADYALMMVHPAQGDEANQEVLDRMTGSIATMIATQTGSTEFKIKKLMWANTWMNAQECLEAGFCDKIEKSDKMAGRAPKEAKNLYLWVNTMIDNNKKNIKTNKKMELLKITNLLGLNDDASVDSIARAIAKVRNDADAMAADNKAAMASIKELDEKVQNLTRQLKDAEDAKNAAELDMAKKRAEDELAQLEATTALASNYVSEMVKIGKIANSVEAISAWKALAIADLPGTKALLGAIPVNNKAAVIAINDPPAADLSRQGIAFEMAKLHNQFSNNR